jgi:L-phenylalanine/L-methionine N-acetyltransferase
MDTSPITRNLKPSLNHTAVRVRAAEPADAQAMSALIGSEGVFEGTLQTPHTAVASRLERLGKTDTQDIRLVAVVQDAAVETVVALAGLHTMQTSLRRSHVRHLAIAVAKEWQGQGVGDLLMAAITDWADNWTHVLRIELTVFADNARAIALYERHGFVKEGKMAAFALRDGAYADALAMARLHPKPPKW